MNNQSLRLVAEMDGKFDEKLSKQITDMEMFLPLKDGTKVAFANPNWLADKYHFECHRIFCTA